MKLLITRGAPASGKTTFARAWVAEDFEHRARVNRDDLRETLFGLDGYTYDWAREKAVTMAQHAAIEALLKAGKDVICDDTNLKVRYVRDLRRIAVRVGATIELHDEFAEVPVIECLRRNDARQAMIDPQVIRDMHARYIRGGLAPIPDEEPLTDRSLTPAPEYDPNLPDCILVDIDGTVALHGDRNPFDYTRVSEDRVNAGVVDILQHVVNGYDAKYSDSLLVVFLSGRKDDCERETREWLYQNVLGVFEDLHMRASADNRPDWQVKYDLYNEHIRGKFNVLAVFDDRDQCIQLWRELGLLALQVNFGDF